MDEKPIDVLLCDLGELLPQNPADALEVLHILQRSDLTMPLSKNLTNHFIDENFVRFRDARIFIERPKSPLKLSLWIVNVHTNQKEECIEGI